MPSGEKGIQKLFYSEIDICDNLLNAALSHFFAFNFIPFVTFHNLTNYRPEKDSNISNPLSSEILTFSADNLLSGLKITLKVKRMMI